MGGSIKTAMMFVTAALVTVAVVAAVGVLAYSILFPSHNGSATAAEPQPVAPAAQPAAGAPAGQPVAKPAAEMPAADAAKLAERRKAAMARGSEYLLKQQAADGSWAEGNTGITSLCTYAILSTGRTIQDPAIRRAVDFILKARKDDGGIYDDPGLKIYTTSIALMVMVTADPKAYAAQIDGARDFIVKNQWDEGESIDRANPWYGGFGYGKHERPDLSNSQFAVEALRKANLPPDHPLWARVVVFLSRTQDLSESNDKTFVGTDSGGFIYSPNKGGESMAGTVDLPDGKKGLKAYGSMTYAGFKSFIYAKVKADDPKVKAALEWMRKHWTWDENPELGQQGLFYFYQTAAKALKAWSEVTGQNTFADARNRPHDWRAELTEAILKRQQADGSWVNKAERWYEGEQMAPVPTSYCLMALAECQ